MSNPSDTTTSGETTITLQPNIPEAYRVLIVDDDELMRVRLATLCKHAGYDVRTAATGEEALRQLDKEFCPLVVTDWKMPDMDGVALCRNLRERRSEAYTYVLMLTVRNSKLDIVAGLNAGADDYVCKKTASSEELLARLNVGRRMINLEQSLRNANRENRRLAITDPLTGARNRRYLMKYLPREYERSRRYRHSLAVLACDIDHFKRINDGFGHDAGDEVLQAFIKRANAVLRTDTDWIARSGGEEFVVVLPETNLSGATTVADKLRRVVSETPITTAAGPLSITVSVGVSAIALMDETNAVSPSELLRVADRCLYISKERGRDRTTAAHPGQELAGSASAEGSVRQGKSAH